MYIDGYLCILLVRFTEQSVRMYRFTDGMNDTVIAAEIPLCDIEDCYNLQIHRSPLMITRQSDCRFQILSPEKADFAVHTGESFLYRDGDCLYFSEWTENPDYKEQVNVRKYPSGELLASFNGAYLFMPDGQQWVLR